MFFQDESKEVSVRNGEVETSNKNSDTGVQISVWFDKKVATVSGPCRSLGEVLALASRACEMARFNQEDPFALLSEKHLWPENIPDIVAKLLLRDGFGIRLGEMKEFAMTMENAGLAVPGVSASGGAEVGVSKNSFSLFTSEGFEGSYESTSYGAGVKCIAGSEEDMQSWSETHNARHFSLLRDPGEMGRLSGETAVSFLGASSIPTREMPVVFDRYVSGSIPSHLVQAIAGENIHQGRSFLGRQSIGAEIFSPCVSIVSDPLIPRLLGSHPFDSEGIAGIRRELVSGGVLKSFVANLRSAAKLDITPTGSIGNLYMENGNVSREALIAGIDRGFLVMEFLGQGPNITTGDYSRGALGFLIENGKLARPITEVTIAGNLKDMWKRLVPANDMELGRWNTPTLRINGMTVAGKE
jgi:PmbA protein